MDAIYPDISRSNPDKVSSVDRPLVQPIDRCLTAVQVPHRSGGPRGRDDRRRAGSGGGRACESVALAVGTTGGVVVVSSISQSESISEEGVVGAVCSSTTDGRRGRI